MLRIDYQRARSGEVESGGDSPAFRSQRRNPLAGVKRAQAYSWIELVLCEQEYARQGKASRGLLRRYIEKITGMSRAQVTRLIGRYMANGRVEARAYRRHRFAARYTIDDVELLASVDEAHDTLSGPATRRILRSGGPRQYGKQEYARLASISVSHIYNLRRDRAYRQRRLNYVKTKPTGVTIAERRRPNPPGQARLCARRRGTSRRSERGQKCFSHQRRGRSDTVADCGRHRTHFRSLVTAGVEDHAGAISLFASSAFTPIMAASSSMPRWLSYWASCSSTRPKAAPGRVMTMP